MRARRRAEIERRLVEVGRRHVAEHGAAGLTVRGVARDLDMVPSALFRYIEGREELLTRLIVACYDELGEQVESAVSLVPEADSHARWQALARACLAWARAHPHDWALLYGSPVPTYQAPAEVTNRAGTRVTDLLVHIGRSTREEERADPVLPRQDSRAEAAVCALTATGAVPGMNAVELLNGITAWTMVVGAISAEVFAMLGEEVGDDDARFDYMVALADRVLFARS